MRVLVKDLEVLWPYDYIYPEQLTYMTKLYESLQSGHCLLEMPTGTGKTVSLLATLLAYQYEKQAGKGKIIYCTRTVQEMDKVVEELRRLTKFREGIILEKVKATASQSAPQNIIRMNDEVVDLIEEKTAADRAAELRIAVSQVRDPRILGVCLSSRRNLCIHPNVSSFDNKNKVDAMCRNLTASFVREQRAEGADVPCCEYFEGLQKDGKDVSLLGIYSLAELKLLGRERGWCPYFFVRQAIISANVVVYNYQYMLDPKISNLVSRELDAASIVVFDEAHNIDNICIEALSETIDARTINAASQNLHTLNRKVKDMERTDAARLQAEYNNLVAGLTNARQRQAAEAANVADADLTDTLAAAPVLPSDVLREAVPGNIRRAKHFLLFMRSIVEYLKSRLQLVQVTQETPQAFLNDLQRATEMSETKALKFCFDRLGSLFHTLRLADIDDMTPLTIVATFATVVATYSQGFAVIFEPFDERTPAIPDPKLQLCCLDASIAMRPVFDRFKSVIITSGTISPLDVYPRMLRFHPSVVESLSMSLARNVICPMIVTKGSDQVPISSKFDMRGDVGVIQNYGRLLVEICSVVPDGVVGFFTSYRYMEDMVAAWKELGVLDQILQRKLIFIETKDIVETTLALDSFKKACSVGRGALFLSVARGKVAEGIDFDRHFGRCVVIFGIPYQYTLSRVLRARLQYLNEEFQIPEQDFLVFDALRQTAQCVGRVIRSKNDYGLMIFADARFARRDRYSKLPKWIQQFMTQETMQLSTDRAVTRARDFLRQMAQPRDLRQEIGVTMLNERQANERAQMMTQGIDLNHPMDVTMQLD